MWGIMLILKKFNKQRNPHSYPYSKRLKYYFRALGCNNYL